MEAGKHNKKKQNRRGKAAWWAVLAVLVALGAAAWYLTGGTFGLAQSAQAKTAVDYKTSTAKTGDVRISVSGSANLIAFQTIDLKFSTSGAVSELNVKLGDQVAAGAVLAKLDKADELEAEIASYELKVLQAQKELKDLQKKAGVSLAEAYQAWVTSQETYQNALFAFERMAYARCSEEVNLRYAAQVDLAKSRLDELTQKAYGSDVWISARATYDTALANYTYCSAYTGEEKAKAKATLDLAESKMKAAETTYTTLKKGANGVAGIDAESFTLAEAVLKEAQVKLQKARADLEGITLVAPMAGKVTYLAASAGAIVSSDAKFITLSDVSRPTIEFYVDENDLNEVVLGYKAEVVFDALPKQNFYGTVTMIEPAMTSQGQTKLVKGLVELDTSANKTLSSVPLGANGSAEIISQESANTLIVPVEAVRDLGDSTYAVFVVGGSGSLALKQVEVGLMDDTQAEIKSGLNAGEVVTTGTVSTSK